MAKNTVVQSRSRTLHGINPVLQNPKMTTPVAGALAPECHHLLHGINPVLQNPKMTKPVGGALA